MFNVARKHLSKFSSPGRLINIFPNDPVFLRNIFSYDDSGTPSFIHLPFLVSSFSGSSQGTIFRTESFNFVGKILAKYKNVSLNELVRLILSDPDYNKSVVSASHYGAANFDHRMYLIG